MASAEEIKARIGSIRQTKKVTDAMYMISSVKMRRAKREVASTEPYFNALTEQISDLFLYIPETDNRYFRVLLSEGQAFRRRGLLLVTSDKGLAGSYNQAALRAAEAYIALHPDAKLFVVGECGRHYCIDNGIRFVEEFHYSAAFPTVSEARSICYDLLEYYNGNLLDEIDIIYTDYQTQKPSECKRSCLLPLERSRFYSAERQTVLKDNEARDRKEFYPDADTVLDGIVPSYLTGFIYSSLVDSYCSEQEARMTAMSSAGKNADEILKQLQMQYNSLRQSAITNEMIEITSGARALKLKKLKAKQTVKTEGGGTQ